MLYMYPTQIKYSDFNYDIPPQTRDIPLFQRFSAEFRH